METGAQPTCAKEKQTKMSKCQYACNTQIHMCAHTHLKHNIPIEVQLRERKRILKDPHNVQGCMCFLMEMSPDPVWKVVGKGRGRKGLALHLQEQLGREQRVYH